MSDAPTSLRELLATGPLATVATIDPDGSPHVTLSWAGFDGDEIVMATFFNLGQRNNANPATMMNGSAMRTIGGSATAASA